MSDLPEVTVDSKCTLQTTYGSFELLGFMTSRSKDPIVVLAKGNPTEVDRTLVRIQSKCETSEIFGSMMCDCAEQLHAAMRQIQSEGTGVLIYLDQEGRGNGLRAKLKIYGIMETQQITSGEACNVLNYPVDARTYDEAAAILHILGISHVRLLTNNPSKVSGLRRFGLDIEREPIRMSPNEHNREYLMDKQRTHGHDLGF